MHKALKIKNDDKKRARFIASKLSCAMNRKIALVDILGLDITCKFFEKLGLKLDNLNCLHKLPFALEEFRISDLNYNGNNIYVVTVFNENFIRIPKIHFSLNLLPNYYVVTLVNSQLDTGIVRGFISPKDVLKSASDSTYYYPRIADLKPASSLIPFLTGKKPFALPFGRHNDAITLFCKVLDGTINQDEKRRLVAHLSSCPVCLNKLLASFSFDNISKNMNFNINSDFSEDEIKTIENLVGKRKPSFGLSNKIDILMSTIPSAENGALNLQHLLDYATKQGGAPGFDFSKITALKDKTLLYFKKTMFFAGVFSNFVLNKIMQLTKKQIIIISVVSLLILGAFAILSAGRNETILEKEPTTYEVPYEDTYSDQYSEEYEEDILANNSLFYAQSQNSAYGHTDVADVSWDVDKSFAEKEEFVNFLQVLGRNIKLNLQNEFILVEQVPINKQMKLKINFSNNALVKNISIVNSSGVEAIDNKILDTLYETLSYVRAPRSGFLMPDLKLFLNITLD